MQRYFRGLMLGLIALAVCRGAAAQSTDSSGTDATIKFSVPEDVQQLGDHGTVLVDADLTTDYHLNNLDITKSSGSTTLDNLALQRLANARLAADLITKKINRVHLAVEFYNVTGLDIGKSYRCDQAVRDADWYARVHNTDEVEQTSQYLLIHAAGGVFHQKSFKFAADRKALDRVWRATLLACKGNPSNIFVQDLIKRGNVGH